MKNDVPFVTETIDEKTVAEVRYYIWEIIKIISIRNAKLGSTLTYILIYILILVNTITIFTILIIFLWRIV